MLGIMVDDDLPHKGARVMKDMSPRGPVPSGLSVLRMKGDRDAIEGILPKGRTYDPAKLAELWNMDYENLALAPSRPGWSLREPRFVLETRVAQASLSMTEKMLKATNWAAVAAVASAVGAVASAIAAFIFRTTP
jgi:hypothetical protein